MTSDKPTLPEHGARVLRFRRGQALPRRPAAGPVPDMTEFHDRGQEADDYRHRMIVNLLAFILVIGLIATGLWLAESMARMRKNQDCVLSGRRGCTPVEVKPSVRWQVPPAQPLKP